MVKNVLKICIKDKKVLPLFLKSIDEENIKKYISRISIFPTILEKIVVDYETELAMITELKPGKGLNGFYFKGFYINSSAIITRVSLSSAVNISKMNLIPIEDMDNSIFFLKDKVIFDYNHASELQKAQIEMVKILVNCGVNPFDLINCYDIKSTLKTFKIIDIIDNIVGSAYSNKKEILRGVLKQLKIIESNSSFINKHESCINAIQKMCNMILL